MGRNPARSTYKLVPDTPAYSSRTRGEAKMPTRRKNPMYYRPAGAQSFRPVTATRMQAMIAEQSPGSPPVENFGDNRAFWTFTRMHDFLAANPQFETARFADRHDAVIAVTNALINMVTLNQISDLAPAGGRIVLLGIGHAVPLYRVLGASTSVSPSDRTSIQPIAVGFVPFRMYMSGRALGAEPLALDYGEMGGITKEVSEGLVRPHNRQPHLGDVVYVLPQDGVSEGNLSHYTPAKVLEVRVVPAGAGSNPLTEESKQFLVQFFSSWSRGVLGDRMTVDEWQVLREDEMPPGGKWTRVTQAEANAASVSASVRAARSTQAPARTMPSAEPPTRPTEALTAAAVAPPSAIAAKKRSKKPTDVIAVLADPGYRSSSPFVVLFDRAVLTRGELSEADVIGYATAYVGNSVARISVAAAEPGYAYLMYATLAKSIASESPGVTLVGSSSQTKYAERFWARQPNGTIGNMPPSLFRRTFGVSYASFTTAGEELVQRLAKARSTGERSSRGQLQQLGSNYFSDYYGVSSNASYPRHREAASSRCSSGDAGGGQEADGA